MSDFNHQQLDELIHSRIRLAIMAVLVSVDQAEFTFLREKVQTTDGNLSIHARKLEEAGYLISQKQFVGKKPLTTYQITDKGRNAFKEYIDHLGKMVGDISNH
jgi:DNA-binding MarR family transcriptional regulator